MVSEAYGLCPTCQRLVLTTDRETCPDHHIPTVSPCEFAALGRYLYAIDADGYAVYAMLLRRQVYRAEQPDLNQP